MGKSIGILSLKGGVGKTSSVVSLGDALASFGKKVLLIDGNFSAPNLGLHLNLVDTDKTLNHVLNRTANPGEAVYNCGDFDLMPGSIFESFKINPFKLKHGIGPLRKNYDVIVIDSSPSLNDETLAVMNASDELLVVTTPDIPTLGMTMKAVKLAKRRGDPISGLIINKIYGKNFEISIEEIESAAEVPVMAVIPHDVDVLRSLSEFKPYTQHKPHSKGSEEYRRLAASMVGERYKPVKMKRFFRWINPKRQDINREIFYQSRIWD